VSSTGLGWVGSDLDWRGHYGGRAWGLQLTISRFSHPCPLSSFPKKDGGKKAAAAPAAKKQAVHEDEVAVVTVMTREHDSDEEVSFLSRTHACTPPTPFVHTRVRAVSRGAFK